MPQSTALEHSAAPQSNEEVEQEIIHANAEPDANAEDVKKKGAWYIIARTIDSPSNNVYAFIPQSPQPCAIDVSQKWIQRALEFSNALAEQEILGPGMLESLQKYQAVIMGFLPSFSPKWPEATMKVAELEKLPEKVRPPNPYEIVIFSTVFTTVEEISVITRWVVETILHGPCSAINLESDEFSTQNFDVAQELVKLLFAYCRNIMWEYGRSQSKWATLAAPVSWTQLGDLLEPILTMLIHHPLRKNCPEDLEPVYTTYAGEMFYHFDHPCMYLTAAILDFRWIEGTFETESWLMYPELFPDPRKGEESSVKSLAVLFCEITGFHDFANSKIRYLPTPTEDMPTV